jgi:hypothetical protein
MRPWDRLYRFAEERTGLEAQELLVTLLLEPYGPLVDGLANTMGGDEALDFRIDAAATLATLAAEIDACYRYALAIDFQLPETQARFWYVSEEKLEPRLGERAEEEGAEREQPLAVARDVAKLRQVLRGLSPEMSVAAFLMEMPEFRHVVRRVQLTARRPYAEIRDNLIDATMRPMDLLRCKLSFFGATDFDPRSDRWVRIALFRHAPFPDELHKIAADDWAIPPAEPVAEGPTRHAKAPQVEAQKTDQIRAEDRYSLNEIDAQIRKAARGAGLVWGLAEEAGKCARTLACSDPQALHALPSVLEAHRAGDYASGIVANGVSWTSPDGRPLSPLMLGPAIADHAFVLPANTLRIDGPVTRPVLLLPFIENVADILGRAVLVEISGIRIALARRNLSSALATLADTKMVDRIELSLGPASMLPDAPCSEAAAGIFVPAALWARFEALAALTYVPASETSRIKGAGAGLNDNE